MGRDHTIHAGAEGYVKYYRDPNLHPDRQYIGVAFRCEDTLPHPPHAARKRRLHMVAQRILPPKLESGFDEVGPSGIPERVVQRIGKGKDDFRILRLQDDYSYREDNYALGQKLGPLDRIRKKGYKSRRLAMRMRRIKKERRHMRLRSELRKVKRDRRETRKGKWWRKILMQRRRAQRAQNALYKKLIEEGKTRDEATEIVGPKIGYDPVFAAKLRLLRSDGYRNNRGAYTKVLSQPRWDEDNLQAAAEQLAVEIMAKRNAWMEKQREREKKGLPAWPTPKISKRPWMDDKAIAAARASMKAARAAKEKDKRAREKEQNKRKGKAQGKKKGGKGVGVTRSRSGKGRK